MAKRQTEVYRTTAEYLFSYGTLQTEAVQLATFGRKLEGKPDALVGYKLTIAETDDKEFATLSGSARQRSLEFTGVPTEVVHGMVLTVTSEELEKADIYEPTDYKRISVQLASGISAWVYFKG